MNLKCAQKPNCVSSLDERKDYFISPLTEVHGPWTSVENKLIKIVEKITNAKKISSSENFIHFVDTSQIFKFKDDVFFWWNPATKELHMKSESRIGYWDMKVNRNRINKIKSAWISNEF